MKVYWLAHRDTYHVPTRGITRAKCGAFRITSVRLDNGTVKSATRPEADEDGLRPCTRCFGET